MEDQSLSNKFIDKVVSIVVASLLLALIGSAVIVRDSVNTNKYDIGVIKRDHSHIDEQLQELSGRINALQQILGQCAENHADLRARVGAIERSK